jgi:hypothetical protein
VITAVCALAGAGMVAGRVWTGNPEPLDLGPAIIVQKTSGQQPKPHFPSPSAPARPATPPAAPAPHSTPPPRYLPPQPPPSPDTGGRPVQNLPPPRSSDGTEQPVLPRPGGGDDGGDDGGGDDGGESGEGDGDGDGEFDREERDDDESDEG